jgi:hypothetical protein
MPPAQVWGLNIFCVAVPATAKPNPPEADKYFGIAHFNLRFTIFNLRLLVVKLRF